MGKLRRLYRLVRRNWNLICASLALIVSMTLGVTSGHWMFYRAGYVMAGLIAVSYVWARTNLRGLEVTVGRLGDRFQVGQRAEARVRLMSSSFFPKLWIEIEDQTDMPAKAPRTVVSMRSGGTIFWDAATECNRRGLFHTGPITITTGDPFGLFRFRRQHGEPHSLLVYPSPEELPYFSVPPAQLSGGSNIRQQTNNLTSNAAGVREYMPGDEFNRIHWRTTARVGRPMVKTFDIDPSSQIWLVLDMDGTVHAGSEDESTEEYAVRAASSIGYHFLQTDRPLGFLASGKQLAIIPPGRGALQYDQIQENLALAKSDGAASLAGLLAHEAARFNKHSTLIVITPSHKEDWVGMVQDLAHRGARLVVVLLDAASFGAREGALLPYSALTAGDIMTYLVRRGDDLSLALGPLGASGEAVHEAGPA